METHLKGGAAATAADYEDDDDEPLAVSQNELENIFGE